ncbi:alpha,alpha-trehalase TreF [Sphingomonas sp. Leaf357]|uniref:alpha,alpha-trehalase TreF n=1 Tax=Sphingomonas sp. Leaf357 TaxID=1736350 RepID=UPI000A90E322|nr:alpha,alpha-trehalase TreF [Sphingomonas sp. Leaf357]
MTDSPAARLGDLFARVQDGSVLADGKTFVDAIPRRAIEAILADAAGLPDDRDALRRFVLANFDLPMPVDAVAPHTPGQPLRAYIRAMWPVLAREPVAPVAGSSALPIAHRHVVPGGRFREIYYWDSYFTMLGLIRDGQRALAEGLVDAMTDLIELHGYVPNGTRSYYLGRSQPPLYYLMVGLLDDAPPAVAARRLAAMKREHAWWTAGADDLPSEQRHGHVARLRDASLLNRYWDAQDTPRDESWREDRVTAQGSDRTSHAVYRDLRAGAESGWDFSSRWLDGAALSSIRTTGIAPVDLNAFLYGLETAIAGGGDSEAASYAARAERRRSAMHAHLWHDAAGHFADYDLDAETIRPQPTAAALAPLFVGLATPRQAADTARFVERVLLAPGGLRTTCIESGEQWDSPNGWAPLQWIAIQGLCRYGHHGLAREISERWIATVEATYRSTGLVHEKYDIETGAIGRGGEYVPQIGFGWTNGVTASLIDRIWDDATSSGDPPPGRPATSTPKHTGSRT